MAVTLHHNAMSTCSQKVRLALEEKGVVWTSAELNLIAREHKAPEYLKINANGVVPTLQVDNQIITESSIINEYINDAFSGAALMPVNALERARARSWIKQVDDGVHSACGILTYATVMRAVMMSLPRDAVLADIAKTPDPHARAVRESLFAYGVDAAEFRGALDTLLDYMAAMNNALASTIFLAGDGFSLADCCALPYVVRFEHMGLSRIWSDGRRPHLHRWLRDVQARPSFELAVDKWMSAQALGMFAMAGEQIAAKLN
jgi:glutathione S-transferase